MRIKDEPEEAPQRWDVESIVGRRSGRGGVEYLVIWEGFSAAQSTWEPVEHLESARDAVDAFEAARPKKRKQLGGGAAGEGAPAAAAAVVPTKRRRAVADADTAADASADPPAAATLASVSDACACCMTVPDAEDVTVTPCGHVFCLACITEWLNQHFDVHEIAPQQRCPVCRAGLRQFARKIHITNAITDAPAAVGAPCPAKKRRPIVPWSVAEAQQLQGLLLAPLAETSGAVAAEGDGASAPRRLGQQVVESSVQWEIMASKLGTGRSSAAVRARARIMGLLVSATTADAAEAAAAAAAAAEAKRITPETPQKQRPRARGGGGGGGGGSSDSAAEAAYKVLLQRIKPLWRHRAEERRSKRVQLLEQQEQQRQSKEEDQSNTSGGVVPIAAAGYDDEEEGTDAVGEERQGADRWRWGGVEGVAPWAEEENSYVNKVLEPSAVEEAEWVVEAVVDKRLVFSGSSSGSAPQEQWEVKWWKWPCTTWEPREHLEGCAELVERYESALAAAVKYAPFDGTTLRGVRAAMSLSRAALAKSIGVKERVVKAWEEGEAEQQQQQQQKEEEVQVPIPFSRQHAVLQLYQASWRAARRNAMLRCGGLLLSTPHKQRLSDGKPCRGFSLIATRARPGIAAFKCLAQANKPKASAKGGGSRRSSQQVAADLQLPLPLELAGSTRSRSCKPCPAILRLGWLLEPPAPDEPDRQWDAEWTPPRRGQSGSAAGAGAAGAGAGDGGVVGGSCLASFAKENGLVAGDVLLVERVEQEEQGKEDSLVLRVVVLWSTVDVAAQRARRGGKAQAGGEKHAAVAAAVADADSDMTAA
jgi:hypothetical protein